MMAFRFIPMTLFGLCTLAVAIAPLAFANNYEVASSEYQRNQAVPVQQVLFGEVLSVRRITERELIEDKANGWQIFGGALIGGAIGYQLVMAQAKQLLLYLALYLAQQQLTARIIK